MDAFIMNLLLLNVEFLQPIVDVLNVITIPVVTLLATGGSIYAIILAVNMAKSDSAEKRETAKKRIIGVLITMATLIILIFGLKLLLENLPNWVGDSDATKTMIGLI